MKKLNNLKIINYIKNNKNKTIEIIFWIILIISLLYIFKDFILGKLYYIYTDSGTDTMHQYFPYYINEVLQIKDGMLSMWNFNYGLGSSILNMNAWTFDIFGIILVLTGVILGVGKVSYLLVWMQILKIIVIYILSKKYMSYFLKNKVAICLASYLTTMSGYIFLWGQHYFFGTSCFFMILMLCAIEYFLEKNSTKSMVFLALTVAVLLIFSYYIAYMILLISAIYFVSRYIYIKQKLELKTTLKDFGKCLYSVITGILISGIIFVPSCYHIMTSSTRLSAGEESIFSKILEAFSNSFNFEYINERLSRLMSNNLLFANNNLDLQTGNYYELSELFCTIFILFFIIQWIIYSVKKAKTKKDYIFLGLEFVALYFLIFNGLTGLIMNAFVNITYRYTYIVIPFLALIVGIVWEKIIVKNQINILGLIISIILSIFVWKCSTDTLVDANTQIIYTILVLLILGFITLFFINKKNKYANIFKFIFLMIIIISTCYDNSVTTKYRKIMNADSFTLKWEESKLINDTGNAINWIKENDKSFYRIEKNYENFSLLGDSFIEQTSSVNWYNTTMNPDIKLFYSNIYHNSSIANYLKRFSLVDKSDLQALYLTNSKYILSKNVINFEGIEQINKIGEIYIYKNTATKSVAKWYNKTITEEEYMNLSKEEKAEKLYEYVIIDGNIDLNEESNANVDEFVLEKQTLLTGNVTANGDGLLLVAIPNEEGWNAYIDGNKVDTYKVDYGFVGIVVPEGEHKIELKYTTPKMNIGIILSIIGIMNLVLIILTKKEKSTR